MLVVTAFLAALRALLNHAILMMTACQLKPRLRIPEQSVLAAWYANVFHLYLDLNLKCNSTLWAQACKCECELCHPKGYMCNDTSVYSPANDESCTVYFAPCCRTVSDHDEPNAGSVLTTFSLMLSILCMSVMLL